MAVTVTCVDDNPTAVNDTKTVAEDSGATAIDVLANDTDPDGGPKTIASATQPAHGTVAVAPDNLTLTYTPNPDYCNSAPPASTDDFTYTPERRLDRDRGGHGELRREPPGHQLRPPGRGRHRGAAKRNDRRRLRQVDGQVLRPGRLLAEANQRRGRR